jgi:hypothetical protein
MSDHGSTGSILRADGSMNGEIPVENSSSERWQTPMRYFIWDEE